MLHVSPPPTITATRCVERPIGHVAVGFGSIRHFRRDFWQVGALAGHDATDECREGGQVPSAPALGLPGIRLSEGLGYGTIPAEVVTHRLLLLDWSRSPERVDDASPSSLPLAAWRCAPLSSRSYRVMQPQEVQLVHRCWR